MLKAGDWSNDLQEGRDAEDTTLCEELLRIKPPEELRKQLDDWRLQPEDRKVIKRGLARASQTRGSQPSGSEATGSQQASNRQHAPNYVYILRAPKLLELPEHFRGRKLPGDHPEAAVEDQGFEWGK